MCVHGGSDNKRGEAGGTVCTDSSSDIGSAKRGESDKAFISLGASEVPQEIKCYATRRHAMCPPVILPRGTLKGKKDATARRIKGRKREKSYRDSYYNMKPFGTMTMTIREFFETRSDESHDETTSKEGKLFFENLPSHKVKKVFLLMTREEEEQGDAFPPLTPSLFLRPLSNFFCEIAVLLRGP